MNPINDPMTWQSRLPWPEAEVHKHARGRLGVVSGGALSTGAARLAARAGLRIGAGLVKVFCPPDAASVLAPTLEAVMLASFATADQLAALAQPMDAVVIGPAAGLTEATGGNVAALARTGAALVIDADALTLFRDRPGDLFACLDRDDVLTPHEGEFERLFPGLLAKGRETAAVEAAERAGAVVVLKGSATVVAAPDGRCVVNGNGSPWLATAGSGDVLAGMIGGLLAQHMDSFDAACAAVWMHADAAGRFGPGLIAEDLPDLIPAVLAGLYPG
ncbi:Bifunctional NAD(P)H-hydrate repair enzyme Nnr [compost metagenome]